MVTIESKILRSLIEETNNETKINAYWKQAKIDLYSIEADVRSCTCNDVNDFYDQVVLKAATTNFITLDQSGIERLKAELGGCPETTKKFKNNTLSFSAFLIETLGYTERRKDFYPSFYADLGIKTCVYCNAQYALTHERNNGKISARYELDHVDNKALYPYLSITLHNLVPVCGVCNKQKSNSKDLDFKLYNDYAKASSYTFSISSQNRAKYLLNPEKNRDILHVKLATTTKTKDPKQNLEEAFSLESLYNTQKDLAEEIIIKSQVYTATYKKVLQKSLRKLRLKMTDRIILGTYTEEKDILKRPMTKFAQDIAIDCGLLKR